MQIDFLRVCRRHFYVPVKKIVLDPDGFGLYACSAPAEFHPNTFDFSCHTKPSLMSAGMPHMSFGLSSPWRHPERPPSVPRPPLPGALRHRGRAVLPGRELPALQAAATRALRTQEQAQASLKCLLSLPSGYCLASYGKVRQGKQGKV